MTGGSICPVETCTTYIQRLFSEKIKAGKPVGTELVNPDSFGKWPIKQLCLYVMVFFELIEYLNLYFIITYECDF